MSDYDDDPDLPYPGRAGNSERSSGVRPDRLLPVKSVQWTDLRAERRSVSAGAPASAAASRGQARREAGTDDDRPYPEDDLPYPGYTPDGPTQIILDAQAYRRAGFDARLGIRCLCGHGIYQASIHVFTFDRWREPEYYCPACMPDELRGAL